MTHILITDLREIRYMAYVPEEPKHDYSVHIEVREFMFKEACQKYQSEIEKATLPFDRIEDNGTIKRLVTDWINPELKPGIYQVPVEVEVVEMCGHDSCPVDAGCEHCKEPVKVARILQGKEANQ